MTEIQLGSWPNVIGRIWELLDLHEKETSPIDCRTLELLYGPAVSESLIRVHGETVSKLMPTAEQLEAVYKQVGGGQVHQIDILKRTDQLADRFAQISSDPGVAIGPRLSAQAQIICVATHSLEPVARQQFQEEFVWNEERRRTVFNDDELDVWHALELQLGMGIVTSIWHAKQFVPDLTPDEFATALLRKYGMPLLLGEVEVYACHWCGTAPCSCGGGKAPARKVTYEDAEEHLKRGPSDTQKGMYFPYAWANIARGGVGYGPFRALLEAAVEKGALLIDAGSPKALSELFGPLIIPQQRYLAEVANRFGSDHGAMRRALLSEFADAVHWQFLNGPGWLDHTAGMTRTLQHIAEYCGGRR